MKNCDQPKNAWMLPTHHIQLNASSFIIIHFTHILDKNLKMIATKPKWNDERKRNTAEIRWEERNEMNKWNRKKKLDPFGLFCVFYYFIFSGFFCWNIIIVLEK